MAAAVQAKIMSDMITSMEFQRPRMTPDLLQWDLDIILELEALTYVPLQEGFKHLTLKTVFLLAWLQPEDAVNYKPLCLICNIYNSNVKGPALHYTLPSSSCDKIRDLTKSMTHGTSQRSRLVSQTLVLQLPSKSAQMLS